MLHCSVPLLCVVVAAAVQLSLALRCYADVVFDVSTGAQTPRESFKPEVSGYCSKVFGVPFPTRFDLPGTTAILADQGYGIYA